MRNLDLVMLLDNPPVSVLARYRPHHSCLRIHFFITDEPAIWHAHSVISETGRLKDEKLLILDQNHRRQEVWIGFVSPVSRLTVLIDVFASVFGEKAEVRPYIGICHLLRPSHQGRIDTIWCMYT